MGVGIAVTRFSVGGPAGVPDADMGMQVFANDAVFELGDFSFFLLNM